MHDERCCNGSEASSVSEALVTAGRLTCEMERKSTDLSSYQHTPECHRVGSSNIATSGLFVCCTLHVQISLHFCLKSDVWDHFVSVCLFVWGSWEVQTNLFPVEFSFIFFFYNPAMSHYFNDQAVTWRRPPYEQWWGAWWEWIQAQERFFSFFFSIYINYCEELSFFPSFQLCADFAWCLQRHSYQFSYSPDCCRSSPHSC